MDNKNAAPERALQRKSPPTPEELHWKGEYEKAIELCRQMEISSERAEFKMEDEIKSLKAQIAAMQPVPSESDEAVAREILDCVFASPSGEGVVLGSGNGNVKIITAILARHRAPVAAPSENTIKLNADEMAQLQKRMDEPAKVHPRLVELFKDGAAPHGAEGLREAAQAVYNRYKTIKAGNKALWGTAFQRENDINLMVSLGEALAQSPTIQAEGWRPIETAPKDGTEYLAYKDISTAEYKNYSVCVCHWDKMDWADKEPCVFPMSDATHWMPLPAAPKGE